VRAEPINPAPPVIITLVNEISLRQMPPTFNSITLNHKPISILADIFIDHNRRKTMLHNPSVMTGDFIYKDKKLKYLLRKKHPDHWLQEFIIDLNLLQTNVY
jgi:hypothetical protein